MLKIPTILFLFLGVVLATTHVLATEFFLYWKYLWLDIPVHMLGGLVIALGMFALHDLIPRFPKRFLYPIPVFLIVLLVSLAWEVFEIAIWSPITDDITIDTAIDLIMDMLGGAIGYLIGYSFSSVDLDEEIA